MTLSLPPVRKLKLIWAIVRWFGFRLERRDEVYSLGSKFYFIPPGYGKWHNRYLYMYLSDLDIINLK